jgi:soluble lytic murein transglycosylase-like protein
MVEFPGKAPILWINMVFAILLWAQVSTPPSPKPEVKTSVTQPAVPDATPQKDAVQKDAIQKQVEAIATKMEASLARQRDAVRRQAQLAEIPEGTPFVLPFPAPPPPVWPPQCDPISEPELASLIEDTVKLSGLQPKLLRAVVRQESSGRPCAVSEKGAVGLMQLMPDTVEQLRVQDPWDPKENLDAGAKYLKELIARYAGNIPLALGAYNAGPSKVDAAKGIPPLAETQDYVKKIMAEISR